MPIVLVCLRIDLLACFGVSSAETSGGSYKCVFTLLSLILNPKLLYVNQHLIQRKDLRHNPCYVISVEDCLSEYEIWGLVWPMK